MLIECSKCINTSLNPAIDLHEGLCSVCRSFQKNFDPAMLEGELQFIKTFIGRRGGAYDALVGISGGKDSSATAYLLKRMGFNPLGFTFDIGYYPRHIPARAAQVAKTLDIDHKIISINKYITQSNIESYTLTADLYDIEESQEAAEMFRALYVKGRNHYSVKDSSPMPYVRTCQLCRKTVIPAYYAEAIKHRVSLVVLGINEWTQLSQKPGQQQYKVSGIRKLHPYPAQPPVYIVHLPFIISMQRSRVEEILKEIAWQPPPGEDLIESNSNSCLFARAAEGRALRLLGFHPDTTRLAREVTVGFISKQEALAAIRKNHPFCKSVRAILEEAGIIKPALGE